MVVISERHPNTNCLIGKQKFTLNVRDMFSAIWKSALPEQEHIKSSDRIYKCANDKSK